MHIREVSQTKQALGGDVSLNIVTDLSTIRTDNLFANLWQQVYVFEKRFSRFLPMSELSLFNRSVGIKMPISTEFRDLLVAARKLSTETAGLFNPFILPALQRAGYVNSAAEGYENDSQELYTDKSVVSFGKLVIGDDWALAPFGTAIDLGGCGKGYLADMLGSYLSNLGIQGYWLSLGGDIVTSGYDENKDSLSLNIQDANNLSGLSCWTVHCPTNHFAVATSGTFRRKGQDNRGSWHHIIDPKTLAPATTDIRLATVCANTALIADVLASCAVILGSKKAPEFLKKHGATAALLQCTDDKGFNFDKQFGQQIKRNPSMQPQGAVQNA